jgi:hypothetical protein
MLGGGGSGGGAVFMVDREAIGNGPCEANDTSGIAVGDLSKAQRSLKSWILECEGRKSILEPELKPENQYRPGVMNLNLNLN